MNKLFKVFSFVCVVLFCWVIYPLKWIRKFIFLSRLDEAKKYADALHDETGKSYYVVQFGLKFDVGTRDYFRRNNVKVKRSLKKKYKGFLNYDYRNAIVYVSGQ